MADVVTSPDRARRNRAARELLDLLKRLAARPFGPVLIPKQHQEDVVQVVVVRLLKGGARKFVAEAEADEGRDKRCRGYLSNALRNGWIDLARRRKQDPLASSEALDHDQLHAAESESADDRHAQLEAVQHAMERVRDHAHEARPARYRADFLTAWQQTWDLAYEARTMTDLVAEERRPGDTNRAAENRIHKRCQRLREALLLSADAMREAGALGDRDHRIVLEAITRFLVRCQTPPRLPRLPS